MVCQSYQQERSVTIKVRHCQQIATNYNADSTHFHQGFVSHLDVTFASESLTSQIKSWMVREEESGSDYNYI